MSSVTVHANPTDLRARTAGNGASARRGKLKIFFGYAPGVGKTHAMLEAAKREKAAGVDVAIAIVEGHGQPDVTSLADQFELIPTRPSVRQGVPAGEFDLDAALRRHPQLILIDELAHTNADASRHPKRWQDVQELLDAGISVFSTLNVQHVESLNDVITQITGITVRETLPDSVLEQADELELIDVSPNELLERQNAGRVRAQRAGSREIPFERAHLVALRELTLRHIADRIGRELEHTRRARAPERTWAVSERLLVCVGPSPTTARLLRSAKRMAAAFGCEWLAVSVEPPDGGTLPNAREQITRHLQLAERLGAEPISLVGDAVGRAIIDYARTRNVTKIIVGKTAQPWWRRMVGRTVVEDLLEHSGDIDVYVIRGERESDRESYRSSRATDRVGFGAYLRSAVVVLACTLVGSVILRLGLAEANIVMTYLVGVAFIAARYGNGPAVAAALGSVLVFDFFFVPPYLTFAVSNTKYLPTFGVMLVIGVVISSLSARLREQVAATSDRERRTAALHRLSRQLAALAGTDFILAHASRLLAELFNGEVAIYLQESSGRLAVRYGERTSIATHEKSQSVARWVLENEQLAGSGSDTLADVPSLFVPLTASEHTIGVLAIEPSDPSLLQSPPQRQLVESCAGLIALALERDRLAIEAQESRLRAESEQLRGALLSCVSHDLRTPLAVIAGAASSLLEARDSAPAHRELLDTVVDESLRMARLVDNLLDMTRLESGTVELQRQWHVLEELVGSALGRLQRQLQGRTVRVDIPPELPLIWVDGVLFEQVLVNLLENAGRYTPTGSLVELVAFTEAESIMIRVSDNGPGLPAGHETRVFEKFYRGNLPSSDGRRGIGLGLAISLAIVRAHGGEITANNRAGGGAEFVIKLPCPKDSPRVNPTLLRPPASENNSPDAITIVQNGRDFEHAGIAKSADRSARRAE